MFKNFKDSLKEFTSIKTLCVIGMLGALSIILSSFSIPVGPVEIGFSSECNHLVDCLFGPSAGAIFGAGMDILKFIIKPKGTFFWGYTFNAALAGLIVGIGLYRKKITYLRVVIVRLINSLIVNVFFGTLWSSTLYGKAFFALLPTRLFKNIVLVPVEALIFVIIYKALEKSGAIQLIRQPFGHKNK